MNRILFFCPSSHKKCEIFVASSLKRLKQIFLIFNGGKIYNWWESNIDICVNIFEYICSNEHGYNI